MANPIDSVSEVAYGSYEFDGVVKTSLNMNAMYNEAETAIKYYDCTLTVEAIIGGSETPDTSMNSILTVLETPGQTVKFNSKGIGNTFQPGSSTFIDYAYGPKPKVLVFETLGSDQAVRIVWTVQFRLTQGISISNGQYRLIEFTHSASLSIRKNGYQDVNVEGRIEIAAANSNVRQLNSNQRISKTFRNLMIQFIGAATRMPSYHLEQDYKFSADDRVCDFTLNYSQIESPNAYPKGVVEIDIEHSMGSDLLGSNPFRRAFRSWTNVMSGSITLRPGVNKTNGWVIFTAILAARIQQGNQYGYEVVNGRRRLAIIKVPIVLSIDINEDDIYSDQCSFSVTWASFNRSITDSLSNSGIFQPTGANWNDWANDIRQNIQNPNGLERVEEIGVQRNFINDRLQTIDSDSSPRVVQRNPSPPAFPIFAVKCPPPEASILEMQNEFKLITLKAEVTHRRYPSSVQRTKSTGSKTGRDVSPGETTVKVEEELNKNIGPSDYIVQDLGNDGYWVLMIGYAIRLGYPTQPPVLKSYGGRAVRLISTPGSTKDEERVLSTSGCPVYINKWIRKYEILGAPQGDVADYERSNYPAS